MSTKRIDRPVVMQFHDDGTLWMVAVRGTAVMKRDDEPFRDFAVRVVDRMLELGTWDEETGANERKDG